MADTAVSHALDVPGACLYYEVRGSGPVLMLIGLPMDSTAFAAVARLLADEYTVVTFDPRGFSRSTIDDPEQDSTPGQLAHRAAAALASQLGTPLIEFPGGHTGFAGEPEPFARVLRRALTGAS